MLFSKVKLAVVGFLLTATLYAENYHQTHPKAWQATTLNEAAMALYGKQKFSTLKQTLNMELFTPHALVEDAQKIPVRIRSNIPAKSVAIFYDGNDRPLVAVFHKDNFEKIDVEIQIRAERKGTLFAVIESLNGVLYYKRAFIDVLCLPCMAK